MKKNPVGSGGDSDSVYDRGHLCPAVDMKLYLTTMSQTFYLSNMSPQNPSFNRGIWETLESRVRTWANEKNEAYVITTPFLKNICTSIKNEMIFVT